MQKPYKLNLFSAFTSLLLAINLAFPFSLFPLESSLNPEPVEMVSHPFPRQDDPFKGTFSGSEVPAPGKPARIVFSINPDRDLSQVSLKLSLPYGVEQVGGRESLQAAVKQGQSLSCP